MFRGFGVQGLMATSSFGGRLFWLVLRSPCRALSELELRRSSKRSDIRPLVKLSFRLLSMSCCFGTAPLVRPDFRRRVAVA